MWWNRGPSRGAWILGLLGSAPSIPRLTPEETGLAGRPQFAQNRATDGRGAFGVERAVVPPHAPAEDGHRGARLNVKPVGRNNRQCRLQQNCGMSDSTRRPDGEPKRPGWIVILTNLALFAAGVTNLGVGTWAVFSGNVALAAAGSTAGLVLLIVATVDRFDSIKGLGIEATTRKLDQRLSQADDALGKLRAMTELTCAVLVDISSRTGRFDSTLTTAQAIALADQVRSLLVGLGSDKTAIRTALEPWALTMCADLARSIGKPLVSSVRDRSRAIGEQLAAAKSRGGAESDEVKQLEECQEAASVYINHFGEAIQSIRLVEYPERLFDLLGAAPVAEEEVRTAVLQKARQFAHVMRLLRDELSISDKDRLELVAELD